MKAHYGKKFILIYMAVNTTIIISAINSLSFIRASSLGSLCTSPTYALGSQTEINYRAIYAIRNSRIIFCMIEEYLKKVYDLCDLYKWWSNHKDEFKEELSKILPIDING